MTARSEALLTTGLALLLLCSCGAKPAQEDSGQADGALATDSRTSDGSPAAPDRGSTASADARRADGSSKRDGGTSDGSGKTPCEVYQALKAQARAHFCPGKEAKCCVCKCPETYEYMNPKCTCKASTPKPCTGTTLTEAETCLANLPSCRIRVAAIFDGACAITPL